MKYLFTVASILLLAGCSGQKEQTHTTPEASAQTQSSAAASQTQASAAASTPKTVAPQLVKDTESSPAALYQKCAACHGSHGDKPALNQSAIIGEWDAQRIVAAIVGYQEGTYGGAMKTLMQNQVKSLSHSQIEGLAEYISHLYVKTH